jgi:hypothetical protein
MGEQSKLNDIPKNFMIDEHERYSEGLVKRKSVKKLDQENHIMQWTRLGKWNTKFKL